MVQYVIEGGGVEGRAPVEVHGAAPLAEEPGRGDRGWVVRGQGAERRQRVHAKDPLWLRARLPGRGRGLINEFPVRMHTTQGVGCPRPDPAAHGGEVEIPAG